MVCMFSVGPGELHVALTKFLKIFGDPGGFNESPGGPVIPWGYHSMLD